MRSLSARTLREMESLARLEWAVDRGQMTVSAALDAARQSGVPEKQLDTLMQKAQPELPLEHATPPVRTAKPLEESVVLDLCRECSVKLGFPVRLHWATDSTRLEIDPRHATELVVPGGLARHPGLTADGLALMIAHEIGHRRLRTRSEPSADYWATRHGLRRLWPSDDSNAFADRAMQAARVALEFCAIGSGQAFSLSAPIAPAVVVPLGSYPALQGRASVNKAGIAAVPMPTVIRETWR